jgi:hypothetical protein
VRNIGAKGETSPRRRTSWKASDSAETWLTITSLATTASPLRARTSSRAQSRSMRVWSLGSKPASAPSNGVKYGRRWMPPNIPDRRVSSMSRTPVTVPARRST